VNSLNRDIGPGEIVVVKHPLYDPPDPFDRAIRVYNGFGMMAATAGTALFGEWLDGTGGERVEGTEIDVKETIAFNAGVKYGRAHGEGQDG
jgi:hypothetical protein